MTVDDFSANPSVITRGSSSSLSWSVSGVTARGEGGGHRLLADAGRPLHLLQRRQALQPREHRGEGDRKP